MYNIFKPAASLFVCRNHVFGLLLIALLGGACSTVQESTPATCYFRFKNLKDSSGMSSDSIYICVVGTNPSNSVYSYVDLEKGTLDSFSHFTSGITSRKLSGLPDSIAIPAIQSARMYIAVGRDFDSANFVIGSGPSMSQVTDGGADLVFDFIEFDTHAPGYYNINSTNVDMYAISYVMSLTNTGGKTEERGISSGRRALFGHFRDIPVSDSTGWYQELFVEGRDGSILRYLAPQQAAYGDFISHSQQDTIAPKRLTRYFAGYITSQVFVPNRTFTFYDKNWPNPANLDTATVSADGKSMTIHKSDGSTLTIKPPVSPEGYPVFPQNWHNVAGTDSTVDWGFMLFGNSLTGSLPGGWGYQAPDPALMALMISICRGVAHLDSGWTDPKKYFGKAGGITEHYAKIIHESALNHLAYAFGYDDIYSQNSSVPFNPGTVITFHLTSLERIRADR